MCIELNHKHGVGSLIGAVFVLLIFISGYSLFLFNTESQTNYQNVLSEMHEVDLRQSQETLSILHVEQTEEDKLRLSIRNDGPVSSKICYIGILNKVAIPETQNYFDVNLQISPTETLSYTSSEISVYEGEEYEIQIITEFGNIFTRLFRPGLFEFDDMTVSIASGGVWEYDYIPESYYLMQGNYISGNWSESIQNVDADYLIIESIYASGGFNSYYPTFMNLVNSTTYVSGVVDDLSGDDGIDMSFMGYSDYLPEIYYPNFTFPVGWTNEISGNISNLISDDGEYMVFSSYPSETSNLTPSRAFLGYSQATADLYPKIKEFNGTWSSNLELSIAESQIHSVRVASCTIEERSYERICAVLTINGYLEVYVNNGTDWIKTIFNESVKLSYRPFDVAYEKTSGRAIIVYSNEIGDPEKDLSYRIWDGRNWSLEYYINDPTAAIGGLEYCWLTLKSNPLPGSNELALSGIDSFGRDSNVVIWNGTDWKDFISIWDNIPSSTYECIAIAYEYSTGDLLAVAANGQYIVYREYTGTWSIQNQFDINDLSYSVMRFLHLKSQRYLSSNRIMLLSLDDSRDVCAVDWSGNDWGVCTNLDTYMETDTQRCIDGDWEPNNTKFVVFGGNSGIDSLNYKTWTPGSGWSLPRDLWETFSGLTTDQKWVQVVSDPRGVGNAKLLIGTLDDGSNLVISVWDGSDIISQVAVDDVRLFTREVFHICYQHFGDPIEFTNEVVINGSTICNNWSELKWTLDASLSVSNCQVTVRLFNFSSGTYSSNGNGFFHYNSNITPNTDDIISQVIKSNPEDFHNEIGEWKLSIQAIKNTDNFFTLNLDMLKIEPKTLYQINIVEFVGSSNIEPWTNLNWLVDSSWNQPSVNTTVQLYDFYYQEFPNSDDGFINYLSSPTPGTDEKVNQSITSSYWRFRASNGDWRLRISGSKKGNSSIQLDIDKISFECTIGHHSASTEFVFTEIPTESLGGLKFTIVSDHNVTYAGVNVQVWNYRINEYDYLGQAHEYYTSMTDNETITVYIPNNAESYVSGGTSKLKITSEFVYPFTQNINEVALDYSHTLSYLPFDTWQSYIITILETATMEPKPFMGLTLYSDGSSVQFEDVSNPCYVTTDNSGMYIIILKSSEWSGETFNLGVYVGSHSADKSISQAPWEPV